MNKLIPILLILLIFVGCKTEQFEPLNNSALVLSYQMTDTSAPNIPKGLHGIFVTVEKERNFDRVDVFVYQNGVLVYDVYSGGDFSTQFLKALQKIPSGKQDYRKLSDDIRKHYYDQGIMLGFTLDGAEYELKISYLDKDLQLSMWNLYDEVSILSEYDESFKSLKELLDVIFIKVGRLASNT